MQSVVLASDTPEQPVVPASLQQVRIAQQPQQSEHRSWCMRWGVVTSDVVLTYSAFTSVGCVATLSKPSRGDTDHPRMGFQQRREFGWHHDIYVVHRLPSVSFGAGMR